MKIPILLLSLFFLTQTVLSQTSYSWNGSVSTAWNTASNWSPNGIPGAADNVTIVTGGNICRLGGNAAVSNLIISSGTFDLGGFTLTTTGPTATFTAGSVQNGVLTVTAATTCSFGAGPFTMNCAVNISSASVTFRNATFQGVTNISKTGAANDASSGNNIFNGVTTITNAGTGNLTLANGNPDRYNNLATFNNTGSGNFYVANNSSNNLFGGVATFNNAPAGNTGIYVSWSSTGTVFNDQIMVSSSSGQGVQFCGGNGTATAAQTSGKTISIGPGGFSSGTLLLRQFAQPGTIAENWVLTGTGNLSLGPSSSFGGDITSSSPGLFLNGATFNGATNLTKTGSTGDNGAGGNIFNGVSNITNSGSNYLLLGNNNPDIWNNDVVFTNNGSERLLPCWATAGNQFNGNISVNTSGSATGIQFCGGNATATAVLAATRTIQAGSTGLTAGYLILKQFTQNGSAAINLNGTGSTALYLGPSSNFGGAVTATAPDIWVQGAVYNGPASFTKTGGTYNHNNQYQNIFNSTCTINQQSNTGYFMLGYNSNDLFNDNIIVNSSGSGNIYLGWTSGTGTPTLAAGKTILVGGSGFSAGALNLNTFTQLGNAPISLNFTGSSTGLNFSRNSVVGGNLAATAPDLSFSNSVFNGTVTATKTGAGNDGGSGGNIFQGAMIMNNTGAGNILFGNGAADKWNSDLTVNSSGSSYIGLAWNSAGNQFNGNIIVSSTGSSNGIQFCSNGSSTAILSSGFTVQLGAGGFSSGTLLLRQFTQLGAAPINLTLTGATTLVQVGPASAIGGSFTVNSPRILLNGAVYTGPVNLTKTGATGEWSYGGNTFNTTLTVNHAGAGYFGFANGAPDIYNGDVYVNNNSTERIIFGNNPVGNQFNGNIILTQVGSSVGIAFGWSSTTSETLAAGKTISIGAAGFNTGYLQIERFTQLGNAPVNLPLTGATSLTFGPTSAIGGDVTSTSGSLYFNGCIFNGAVDCTKTGATGDNSNGNNIFNGVTTITNAGSGNLVFGNGNADQFNTTATFNNTGAANIYVANNSNNNVFGGVTGFNNTPTANTGIYVSWNSAGTVFSDNVIVTSTGGQGVQFSGGNATATTTLATNKTISIGTGGFSAGTLLLRQFTQTGPTAETLLLTGTAALTYGPLSSFGGDINSSSATLYLNGATFNGSTNITKTGSTGDYSAGGNVFNGVSSITNSGSSYLLMGNSNPDIWNNDVIFTNNGSERLLPCWASVGNQFNGNIIVNSSGSATGIQFCGGNNSATAILAATKTIQSGTTGLTAGYLILKQFTQNGNAAINLSLANTATYLQFGPSSALGGDVTSTSPGLLFNGCTFNGMVNCTKTGGSNDGSAGNNIFNGVTTVNNAGAGYLMLGNGNRDQFNAAANFYNTGSNNLWIAYNSANNVFGGPVSFSNTPVANTQIGVSWYSAGTLFNENIIVNSNNGQGVQFCGGNTSASAALADGKTVTVGAGGFSAGMLNLRQFTQIGLTPQNITLTGSGNLTFGPASVFGGNTVAVAPSLFFNGCNFGGTLTATKNGSTNDGSIGNNVFNGAFVVTNTGSGYFLMGNGNPDLWQSTAVFNNQGTAHLYTAYNSTGNSFNGDVVYNDQPGTTGAWIYPNYYGSNTQYNGNITVVSVNGAGVYFGNSSGTAVLSPGKTISVGAGGFNYGGLVFRNFTQSGATPQMIVSTGASYISFGANASFDGAVTSSSPGLFFNGCTFNGLVNCTKTGGTSDQSQGNNIFNAQSTLTNNGTGYLMMTTVNPDAYNGNISFVQNGSGAIYPNYNGISNYAGNVTVTSPGAAAITFGANNGTANFSGSGAQTINAGSGTPIPVFTRLTISNTGAGVSLNNTSVNISKNLTLNSGLLNTSTTFILTMLNGSVTAAGTATSTSFVNGPMRYQKSASGATTLNFPIGNGTDCRPVTLTVNHSSGTLYTYQAQLFNASARALNYSLPPTVDWVSDVHYYTISRVDAAMVNQPTAGLSGNQTIQVFFGPNDAASNGSTLTIVKNTYLNPTKWIDVGGFGGPVFTGGASLTGSITSTSVPTAFNSFSTFALGNQMGGGNLLPVSLLDFEAKPDNHQVDLSWTTASESNNSFFTVEKSRDAAAFEFVENVNTKAPGGNSSQLLSYTTVDLSPLAGVSYYRLKQTDLDGNISYSKVLTVNFAKTQVVSVFPNPSAGLLHIVGLSASENNLKLFWYDLTGRNLLQQTVHVENGGAQLNVPFSTGMYVLRFVTVDGLTIVQNIIIGK